MRRMMLAAVLMLAGPAWGQAPPPRCGRPWSPTRPTAACRSCSSSAPAPAQEGPDRLGPNVLPPRATPAGRARPHPGLRLRGPRDLRGRRRDAAARRPLPQPAGGLRRYRATAGGGGGEPDRPGPARTLPGRPRRPAGGTGAGGRLGAGPAGQRDGVGRRQPAAAAAQPAPAASSISARSSPTGPRKSASAQDVCRVPRLAFGDSGLPLREVTVTNQGRRTLRELYARAADGAADRDAWGSDRLGSEHGRAARPSSGCGCGAPAAPGTCARSSTTTGRRCGAASMPAPRRR